MWITLDCAFCPSHYDSRSDSHNKICLNNYATFLLHFTKLSMGFELIYWIYMGGYYFLVGFNLEKCGNLGKTAIFSVI